MCMYTYMYQILIQCFYMYSTAAHTQYNCVQPFFQRKHNIYNKEKIATRKKQTTKISNDKKNSTIKILGKISNNKGPATTCTCKRFQSTPTDQYMTNKIKHLKPQSKNTSKQ